MTRVAVVDIGSNSTRLLLAEVEYGRVRNELEKLSTVTRLGQGVDRAGHLAEEAMERVYRALSTYSELVEQHGATRRVAVLTSAVRDAANGHEFAAAVSERFGFTPHVLKGEDEARLTFLGATSERDASDSAPTLVVDIGGGSTELVIGQGQEMSFHVSTQAGVVRQSERHLDDDPPTDAELDALAADVRRTIEDAVPVTRRPGRGFGEGVEKGIAVAGTATSMAAIAQRLEPFDPTRTHGYRLSAQEAGEILARLRRLPLEERKQTAGLHPDRAATILAGAVILREVMAMFSLDEVEVSEHDILRGAALELT